MKTITVQVREDHLETLARTKPMAALSELIWNAFDAEATSVNVEFVANDLEGVDCIRITDNGHGLSYQDALIGFQNLGGSWKREGGRTPGRKRALHGKFGKGRFRAFSLGNRVEWNTVFRDAEGPHAFGIHGEAANLGEFSVSDPASTAADKTGMVVSIYNLNPCVGLLQGVKALAEVTDIFSLYLQHYPDVRLTYDKVPIDPSNAQTRSDTYGLGELVMQNGERVWAELTIVEWSSPGKRGVLLCDEDGFVRHNALPRLHFRGFSFTAYVKSAYVATLDAQGLLETGELAPDVRQILDAARSKLREHFTLREAENALGTIQEWREQGIYPYAGEAITDADENERRIFNIYATHLNQILPDFAGARPHHKRLVLRLVQELVHTEPTRIARILDEVLDFPEDKEDEVQELLQA